MPPSAAESYLSAIAPPAKLPPCVHGYDHSFRVCMGSLPSNSHEIGRRYSWCHGGNRRCVVSDKGPVLSVAERTLLRQKLNEFKEQLKTDKKEIKTAGGRTAAKRKRARSITYDEDHSAVDDDETVSDTDSSQDETVKVHMYFGPDTMSSHDGIVINGSYSFREDIHFCELGSWPETHWLMFDVIQKRWIDIPALARLEVGSGPLVTRYNDPEVDLTTYENLDSLLEKALDAFTIDNVHSPSHARCVPQKALPTPSSSQTTAGTSSPVASQSRKHVSLTKGTDQIFVSIFICFLFEDSA
ncbi:hypothetical protein HYPSUDRAFT_208909 [Hypholoma sublateritium FD-334 SS-4]|uniref:Uncharacterized protein n=1 Tax=Hypholoma sublateritium (strain FD-334 SS-4) TaxID=945553 RepID=A0A0D2LTS0_HYPSF|nr:hypothetical protein HYPSUDRAFT_208909 [Hypholoma sublateritium FD-334 SS-4]